MRAEVGGARSTTCNVTSSVPRANARFGRTVNAARSGPASDAFSASGTHAARKRASVNRVNNSAGGCGKSRSPSKRNVAVVLSTGRPFSFYLPGTPYSIGFLFW